jgi:hypothetical protein
VIGPTQPRSTPPNGADRPKPLDEHALLRELWQISHFGWIPEAAICRSLTIGGGQEIPAAALAERLAQLLQHGLVEHRHIDAGAGQREWRLTDIGRNAR